MSTDAVIAFVQAGLRAGANPEDAPGMEAYMKSETPYLGVRSPVRKSVMRDLKKRFVPQDAAEVLRWSQALWTLDYREERYMAISVARAWRKHITLDGLPHYEHMIRTGAWWDYVDDIATNLVGKLWRDDPAFGERMDAWIEDPHLWIRRVAIIGQLKHKENVDEERLFRYCLQCAHEKDFFIRKAIGWALRSYARVAPDTVRAFTEAHRDRWSGLTWREARKHLG